MRSAYPHLVTLTILSIASLIVRSIAEAYNSEGSLSRIGIAPAPCQELGGAYDLGLPT